MAPPRRDVESREPTDEQPLLAGDGAAPKVFSRPRKSCCSSCACVGLLLFLISTLLFAASIGLYFETMCGAGKGEGGYSGTRVGSEYCPHYSKAQAVFSTWKSQAADIAGQVGQKVKENVDKIKHKVDELKQKMAPTPGTPEAPTTTTTTTTTTATTVAGTPVANMLPGGVVDGTNVKDWNERVQNAAQNAALVASARPPLSKAQLQAAKKWRGVLPEDAELFERAVSVTPAPSAIPKVAFLFLTPGSLPLAPLWARFFQGHEDRFSVYVHAAPKFVFNPKTTPKAFQGRQVPSQAIHPFTTSTVDAQRRLIANALLDPSNQHFVLLSDTSIPLFPFDFVYKYIRMEKLSHVEAHSDAAWTKDFLPLIHQTNWKGGSQYFELSRSLALKVIQDIQYYPKFHQNIMTNTAAEEHYIQTLLSNVAPAQLANRTVMYTSPRAFGAADAKSKLINNIKGIKTCTWKGRPNFACFLFAQKFNQGTLNPLLKLSKDLGY